jgi:3-hydroxyacyl-CoA dehydrogenase/enoyl-CoA hydratase/3-hydroxybutyryl-CoA epimerase
MENGDIGVKSGQGFYTYDEFAEKIHADPKPEIVSRLIGTIINECELCLEEGVVDNADLIDSGIIFGTGFAPFRGGPLHYFNEVKGII